MKDNWELRIERERENQNRTEKFRVNEDKSARLFLELNFSACLARCLSLGYARCFEAR